MPPFCRPCDRSFKSTSGFTRHVNAYHKHPLPKAPASNFRYHRQLSAKPCNVNGDFLPAGTPPEPPIEDNDPDFAWAPFNDRPSFHFAEHLFSHMESSGGDTDKLLHILEAREVLKHGENAQPIYHDKDHVLNTIDAIDAGETSWDSFSVQYTGPVDAQSASWKRQPYLVHARNTLDAVRSMLANRGFDGQFHYRPFEEYTGRNKRRFSDLMSGRWIWKQADKIAADPETHGAMVVPIILGADKTTVSVATGHTEFHPVYMSVGNVYNETRRAHGDALIPIAFLAIPKVLREHVDDEQFRHFRKQLYHASLAHILEPLREAMSKPIVLLCPDGHRRRVIFEIGPFIADYPEQVYLAGIVQGWCPKCLARPDNLDAPAPARFRAHTEVQVESFDARTLWDTFGTVSDIIPFTNHFPRADIHELITPDILHQLVKGTFKDHLVTWVEEYLREEHSQAEADRIMDDIDRRIAAAPAFPGLRRFPEGRNFKQWTGDDSKALMKVFLPAIVGHVPEGIVKCISAFLDFCYLVRRPAHDTDTLATMEETLHRFHHYRQVFIDLGVRPDGISLPRQHSLVHYVPAIRLFASPNGLCSSITESKHIRAVKKPWRRSSRHKPLAQIIRTNTRLSKLAAARTNFAKRGMLEGDMVSAARIEMGLDDEDDHWVDDDAEEHATDLGDADGPRADSFTVLATKPACSISLAALSLEINEPELTTMIRQFIYDRLYGDEHHTADDVPLALLPPLSDSIHVRIFNSAISTFYAPSEISGRGGMHRERVRSTSQWFGQPGERRDTMLVQNGCDNDPMGGMVVARVMRFISLKYDGVIFPCALVNWFLPVGEMPDTVTGMWVVEPEKQRGRRTFGIIHLDACVRGCHLIPKFRTTRLPPEFLFSDSLDAFRSFYVNHYIDYHAHECIPR